MMTTTRSAKSAVNAAGAEMRCLLDANARFQSVVLNGEINKQGHRLIASCSPDFVFHKPGVMESNVVVAEVKAFRPVLAGRARHTA
jgi:hypothetical protein